MTSDPPKPPGQPPAEPDPDDPPPIEEPPIPIPVPPIEPPPEPLRATVPSQVGSVHFETFGKLISVRCPREYAGMMRQHGGE
jgi:hypothetical protein